MKECNVCKGLKDESSFYKNGKRCKECISQIQKEKREENPLKFLIEGCKQRAKKKGLDFNLRVDDLEIPEYCPILGIKLEVGIDSGSGSSPSIDRIDNERGYTLDNVKVISNRANTLKGDATVEEMEKILRYMKKPKMKMIQRGSKNIQSKLVESEVVQIREMNKKGWSQRELANKFGVSDSVIGRIVRREKWKHVK